MQVVAIRNGFRLHVKKKKTEKGGKAIVIGNGKVLRDRMGKKAHQVFVLLLAGKGEEFYSSEHWWRYSSRGPWKKWIPLFSKAMIFVANRSRKLRSWEATMTVEGKRRTASASAETDSRSRWLFGS